MTSVIAKTVFKFWSQWGADVSALFQRHDSDNKGYIKTYTFFTCLTSCGLNLSSVITDKIVEKYAKGSVLLYKAFMNDLEADVKLLQGPNSVVLRNTRNNSVIIGLMDGSIKANDLRPKTADVNPIFDEEEKDIDYKEAEAQFREKFNEWVDMVTRTFEETKAKKPARDMTADEKDRYASVFFLLIAEETYRRRNGGAPVREIPDLLSSVPDWPQTTISYEMFHRVCRRELVGVHHLNQLFRTNAVPAKTIHTTLTFQQFSVLACGVSNISISRLIESLKNAPNSSAMSSTNANTGNGLYSRFNTWKDFSMGFVSGKSLFEGIKVSIPSEPCATITRFVKACVRKEAKMDMLDSEPASFPAFSELMRNECLKQTEGTKAPVGEPTIGDEELVRSVRTAVLEASEYNPDKVYDMLVYAAINNPPYRSDVVTADAVLRAITSGLGVRLNSQQQAIIARVLRESGDSKGDLMPVRLFLKVFGISRRGAMSSIPPAVTSPEHHGRFIFNAHKESTIMSPTIARHVNPELAAKQNNSRGVTDVLEHLDEIPPKSPSKPIQETEVLRSFTLGPEKQKTPPKHKTDRVSCAIAESEQLYADKRKEMLDKASLAQEKRKMKGESNDIYRSGPAPPSRRGSRANESRGMADAMSWNY